MGKYFNKQIYTFDYKQKNTDKVLKERNYFIVGDFWGIQSFIFDGLTTTNAAKVLRAKSAYVQIITEVIAKYICESSNVGYEHILTTNAGKFEVLLPNDFDVKSLQERLDRYFLDNFYGISGIGITKVEVSKDEWENSYKNFRQKVAKEVEKLKFKKFNLLNTQAVLEYDEDINNQNLCKICNTRKGKDGCSICNIFVELGKNLTKKEQVEIDSDELGITFVEKPIKIVLNKRLKSYIPRIKDKYEPLSFEKIADNSCKNSNSGIKALGILKADVDGMGDFIKNSGLTDNFENFDYFSKGLDSFFSLYVTDKLKNKYKDIYTVFAGGDDLFLVGAWDEVMNFSREIRDEFKKYVTSEAKDLTISFGVSIAKPSTPISYLANHTEELLEHSKEVDGKDALTIWSESVKWDSYIKVYNELEKEFNEFELNTTLLYRLLEFCAMSKNIDKDIKNTLWKSKLNYLFSRNVDEKYHNKLEILDKSISNFPSETKIFLSEFIYKRREV